MDIQEEKADFEADFRKTDFYKMNLVNCFCFINDRYVWDEIQAAWEMWQASKAKAVPKGFVLMPKEPTDEIIEAMNEFDYRNDYSDMDGAYRTIVETLEKAQEDAEREQKG